MPNWCIGDMKIRGRASDICKFLEENLVTGVSYGKKLKELLKTIWKMGISQQAVIMVLC